MARYTGPNNKQARRVGFSILENGKDLKRPFGPGRLGLCLANMNEDARAMRIFARAKRVKNETVRRKADRAIKAMSCGASLNGISPFDDVD